MFRQADCTYYYDGTFDGLLCCVFESYEKKEIPLSILVADTARPPLFGGKLIASDHIRAGRVLSSIPVKLGTPALHFIRRAFLTCLEEKELYILQFLRLGYTHGPSVLNMLTHPVVNTLNKAVRHLDRESHLFKGFLRFSIVNNLLVGELKPKNFVLPLLAQHFCERYPEERFLIHDQTHGMALVYQPYQYRVIPLTLLEMPAADEEEQHFRSLWQLFYDTIAIQGRYNPKCRMSHMPMRYWQNMTEFCREPAAPGSRPGIPDTGRLLLKE